MQTNAHSTNSILLHEIVTSIVDGDGFITQNKLTGVTTEFRLLGIDAPEIKWCTKIKQDEKETHIAAGLLVKLGLAAKKHLSTLIPPKTNVILKYEGTNTTDVYGRHLVYAYHPNDPNICVNVKMIIDGYAKPYSKVFCNLLSKMQEENRIAKQQKRGLYQFTTTF